MKITHKILGMLLFFFVISCKTEPIELNVPASQEKIVVASQYTDNGVLILGLTKTFNVLKNVDVNFSDSVLQIPEELLVENADVFITVNGVRIKLKEWEKGVYFTEELPDIEKVNYQLEIVSNSNAKNVIASTQMQKKITFDTTAIIRAGGSAQHSTFYYSFSNTNLNQTKEYYLVTYYSKPKGKERAKSKNYAERLAQSILLSNSNFDIHTSDEFIDGKLIGNKVIQSDMSDSLLVSLSQIDQGYYEFLNEFKKSKRFINQIKNEPIYLPSNIKNGYGFFALTKPDIKLLKSK